MDLLIKSIDEMVSNREVFDHCVYVSADEAIKQFEQRQSDNKLKSYVENTLPCGVPQVMRVDRRAVIFRHVATTNYEIIRFLSLANALGSHKPLILEYTADKFLSRNYLKHSLGKLRFNKGINKNGEQINEAKVIIDFHTSDNKPLSEVKTFWGEGLVDFHHELFNKSYHNKPDYFFDLSSWLRSIGGDAKTYYKQFLTLFLRDGILFENFLLDKNEMDFTKNVIVPIMREIVAESGYKPLIVALVPTETEVDTFWLSHPFEDKKILDEKWQK